MKRDGKIKYLLLLFCILPCSFIFSQKKTATVSGKILNENDQPLQRASIQVLNQSTSTQTNDSGYFSITVAADKAVALVFSYTAYKTIQKNFFLHAGEQESVVIKLQQLFSQLQDVFVKDERDRNQAGLINIDANQALNNPSPVAGIESLIKVFVGSNNELTSQYSVRGGSYDENLVYVNDFEIYRPYLVRSGQQEGLSFINPELTGNVKFYNGGYPALYGDKLSSVLDVTYREPKKFGGSAYAGLLEQGFHLEAVSAGKKSTLLLGLRNRSNRNLLSAQSTKGNYIPASSDIQALVTLQATVKLRLEAFTNISSTSFTLFPQESQLTSSVFSPQFSGNIGLDIFFSGQEKDRYATKFIGLTAIHQTTKNLQLKWLVSYFNNKEEENIDITGAYIFGERGVGDDGQISNPLGTGATQNYARNGLNIRVLNASHKGSLRKGQHYLQWGNSIDLQQINDRLHEFEFRDSAGYSLPYDPSGLEVFSFISNDTAFNVTRTGGYIQDNIRFSSISGFTIQAGLRYNYNTLNKEFLLSPRIGFSFKPSAWRKDLVFKAAVGRYVQPPFYREMRRYDGSLNTSLSSQKSWQVTGGVDYNFSLFRRPAKLVTEIYYKHLTDVVPYDIDNVRTRYYAQNNAKAYSMGVEARLFGEMVKDAESWISLGIMKTRENIVGDFFTNYFNAGGELINANTPDKQVTDSTTEQIGWLRRPTDRLVTFGMFFQDYLSTNKNFKVYFNMLYGSNLPYNIPGNTRYRNALQIEPYIRVDIGFSAALLPSREDRRSHSPFRVLENLWLNLEIFNVIDRLNTISYQLIKDADNNTYTLPNRLTPRLVNLKLMARW